MSRHTIEFITPAFLTGANQNRAELRAPSIRGELRWWFRALGGTPDQERDVFGGVHGDPAASKVVVRVSGLQGKHVDLPRECTLQNSDLGYLYHFAKVSGNKEGVSRIQRDAFFSPGTAFTVELAERRALDAASARLLRLSSEATWLLGALGLRARRGCGAMAIPASAMDRAALAAWSRNLPGVSLRLPPDACPAPTALDAQRALGAFLRQFRKDSQWRGKPPQSLGASSPREASSVRLRPIRLADGTFLPALVHTASASTTAEPLRTAFLHATEPV